jgi:hypothetical protein
MNNLSSKIGYWSALSMLFAFAIWILSFAGIAVTSPLFYWTNLPDYIVHYQSTGHHFQHLAFLFTLFIGPLYLLIINGYYEYSTGSKKALVRISLLFGLGFAILSSLHYFVQLSSVRLNLLNGNFDGMEAFIQANPLSIMTSIDMLGWTLFLGLSSLFLSPVFSGEKSNSLLRYAFLFNGLSCMMAGVGYVLRIDILTFICINICTGGAMMVISIASLRLFARQQN